MTMTPEAKRSLSKTIRSLRAQLLMDLADATEGTYRLSVPAKLAKLDARTRENRQRLESWIAEQVRSSSQNASAATKTKKKTKSKAKAKKKTPKPVTSPAPLSSKAAAERALRFRRQVEKEAAARLLQRLTYVRLLEAAGLSKPPVVTGGWDSRGYKDFREVAPELARPDDTRSDDTEGYALLLQLIFDELAVDLPGLFGDDGLLSLVPIPASTLRSVVTALDDPALASAWTDDTTLGWIYQYWNDPEREALDDKLHARHKLQNHEIASKTQMFTERYMVEWLLHNSLGPMWLAMCKKHGWTSDVEARGVLDDLDQRRAAWRARREAGDVALDALMPIADGLESQWKYFVPQPIPDDAVPSAPESVRDIKLLDPACGSGHFLVIAFSLLVPLYREEARHRGQAETPGWSDEAIVESIVENNLHGIDIDPRAVQTAAAALMLEAKKACPSAAPRVVNLVAPALNLAGLADDDPALVELVQAIERDTGLPGSLTRQVVRALAGADHLGTLLKVDTEVAQAIAQFQDRLSTLEHKQGSLFHGYDPQQQALPAPGFGPVMRKDVTPEQAHRALFDRLSRFLEQHSTGDDLGLRLRGRQLAAGVRFLRLAREGQYDLVVGNPPYQGTSKMADASYIVEHYPRGKADLYAAFLQRGLELARDGGMSALLTMRNWMFIKQYTAIREWLLENYDLRALGDFAIGAFDEVPNDVLSVVVSVFHRSNPHNNFSVATQPTPPGENNYDRERTNRKRAAVLCHIGRHEFQAERLLDVEDAPVLYWWSQNQLSTYIDTTKIGTMSPAREGLTTADNARFRRYVWETMRSSSLWKPLVAGAGGRVWIEPSLEEINFKYHGLALKLKQGASIRNERFYFRKGIAFTTVGATFGARKYRVPSIFEAKGRSVFPQDLANTLCVMNASYARRVLTSLNPSIDFTVGDVNRLPLFTIDQSSKILKAVERAFTEHESHREPSVEYRQPGPSPWRYAQNWAQRAVDRPDGAPLPDYEPEYDPEPATDHLSYAIGVALGRFDAHGEGILDTAPDTSLPHGLLFLSAASDHDSLEHPACQAVRDTWRERGPDIDAKRTLKAYLQQKFFADVHRKMYENRPIYLPLSSAKKNFVAYASIHRFDADTLRALLAEHLLPTQTRLDGELTDLRQARLQSDKKAARAAERRFDKVNALRDELNAFIDLVGQCAEQGPPVPTSTGKKSKSKQATSVPERERDARYDPVLDDGVMINAAGLWPLLEPQWKDPKKWWTELATARDKKDYDWSHLARRYFPTRVDAKCDIDPSLAVAHGCFWNKHPAKAYEWELRLQDEIAPDFTLDEADSDAARAAFEADNPEEVEALVAKEHKRRARKRKKQAANDDKAPATPAKSSAQTELGLEA